MSKFMQIAGIVAAAAGIAIILMAFFSPGQMQIYGLTAETGSILLVGGLLMIGVGGLVIAIETSTRATLALRDWLAGNEAAGQVAYEPLAPAVAAAAAASVAISEVDILPVSPRDPLGEEMRSAAEAGLAAARAKAEETVESSKETTEETLASLEKAQADLAAALDLESKPEEPPEATPEPELEPEPELDAETEAALGPEPDEGEAEDQLYVVEEKLIRGRPARVLSDGTVEAETDEGWMRFENIEHLEEYLDAMSPVKA